MSVHTTSIEGLLVIEWDTYEDDRGFFRQTYQVSELEAQLGREVKFKQGNHSCSKPGVLRGFHAEPWDKCVYIVKGHGLAVIADIRPDSPTFGKHESFLLGEPSEGKRQRLFISKGLANSFMALGTQDVHYLYDVTDYYRPDVVQPAIIWNDPDLNVQWPSQEPILSPKDKENPTLRELFSDHPLFAN